MNNDKSTRFSQYVFVIFSTLTFVVIIVLSSIVYSMNETLKKQQSILLQVPPELNSNIEAQFQKSADLAKEEVVGIHYATSAEIKNDAKKQLELQNEAIQECEKQLENIKEQLKLQKDQLVSSADNVKKQALEICKVAFAEIKTNAEKQFANQRYLLQKHLEQIIAAQEKLPPELAKLNKNIETVVQANNTNQKNAEFAIGMAKKALESNDLQLAQVYTLNAINHDSSNTSYLVFYNDLLNKKEDLSISDIDQFISVLDLAVFQIDAHDIPAVVSLKETILSKRESIVTAMTEAENREIASQTAAKVAELRGGRLSLNQVSANGAVNESLLKERLEALSALLADVSLSQNDLNSFSEDLRYSTGLYSIVTTISAARNAVDKAESLAQKDKLEPTEILTARNQLQTGNTLLAQIWSSDCSKYQDFVSVAQKIQADIASVDKKLNIIASAPAKAKIENLVASCQQIANSGGTYTHRIEEITAESKEFPQLLSSVYDPDLRVALTQKIETVSPIVSSLSKARYEAYQKWAIDKLDSARKAWNSSGIAVDDDEAISMFENYIMEINPALLLPDVNSLYNSLYQLIYNELPDKAGMQYKKAISQRVKQLEDF